MEVRAVMVGVVKAGVVTAAGLEAAKVAVS